MGSHVENAVRTRGWTGARGGSGRRAGQLMGVAVLFVALLSGFTPASAAPPTWPETLATALDDAPDSASRPMRDAALQALRGSLDDADLDAAGALRTAYADGTRTLDGAATQQLFATDQRMAQAIHVALTQGATEAVVDAAGNLLWANRATADTLIADATAIGADSRRLENRLRQGVDEVAKGDAHWRKGQLNAAVVAYGKAADRAWEVLSAAGVDYSPDADLDSDGVADVIEMMMGADPRVVDTDGDGLSDAFEILTAAPWHLPDQADTDGDGIGDGAEDEDGDGLTALDEQDHQTDPRRFDSDGEGLSDGEEVSQHGTDPNRVDTDDDGLDDAAELRAGTDPLSPDSDGDGIPDGQDVNVTRVEGPDGVAVEISGTGDLAGALDFNRRPLDDLLHDAPGQVSAPVDITLAEDAAPGFVSARITLPYDDQQVEGDEGDLRLFWFDPEQQFWVPAAGEDQQVVDIDANRVTATVDHFSIYAIFNIANWEQEWTALGGSCAARGGGDGDVVFVDVAFTLDSSGSMDWNDPQGLRKQASKNFVDALLDGDRAAVVDFNSWARLRQGLTTDRDAVKAAIDQVGDSGGTNIGAGVDVALDELERGDDDERAQIVILLTDGVGSYSHTLTERAGDAGVTIYTIGLGSGVDDRLLREIAERTGGSYYPVAVAEDLPDVFREIGEDTGDTGEDTDGDGLTDCVEERGIRDHRGDEFTSDPRLVDTDGDGLDDGEEVGEARVLYDRTYSYPIGRYYPVYSDPRRANSDGDTLDDAREHQLGTNPRRSDTDGDGLDDDDELAYGTDPTDPDTDDDGLWDGEEVEIGMSDPTADDRLGANAILDEIGLRPYTLFRPLTAGSLSWPFDVLDWDPGTGRCDWGGPNCGTLRVYTQQLYAQEHGGGIPTAVWCELRDCLPQDYERDIIGEVVAQQGLFQADGTVTSEQAADRIASYCQEWAARPSDGCTAGNVDATASGGIHWDELLRTAAEFVIDLPGGTRPPEPEVQQAKQELEGLARRAVDETPRAPGESPQKWGTRVHQRFKQLLDEHSGSLELHPETGYVGGRLSTRNGAAWESGTTAPDAVLGPTSNPRAVFDLKTGASGIRSSWARRLRGNLPASASDIPIIEIRP